jgi:hypothetical protein
MEISFRGHDCVVRRQVIKYSTLRAYFRAAQFRTTEEATKHPAYLSNHGRVKKCTSPKSVSTLHVFIGAVYLFLIYQENIALAGLI